MVGQSSRIQHSGDHTSLMSMLASGLNGLNVCVVGSGVAGLVTALLFNQLGARVVVYEERSLELLVDDTSEKEPHTELSERLVEELRAHLPPLRLCELGVSINSIRHLSDGTEVLAGYRDKFVTRWSTTHKQLESHLRELFTSLGLPIHYRHVFCECNALGWCTFKSDQGTVVRRFDLVIGADGPGSHVGEYVRSKHGSSAHESTLATGSVCLRIPPMIKRICTEEPEHPDTSRVQFQPAYALSRPHCAHIWYGRQCLLTAVPLPDKSYALRFLSAMAVEGSQDVPFEERTVRAIEQYASSLLPVMPNLRQDLYNTTCDLLLTLPPTILHDHRIVLVGAAAHQEPPCPFLPGDAALQDVLVLNQVVHDHLWTQGDEQGSDATVDLPACAAEYARRRLPELKALSQLCSLHHQDFTASLAEIPGGGWAQALCRRGMLWLAVVLPTYFAPVYIAVALEEDCDTSLATALQRVEQKRWWARAGLLIGGVVGVVFVVTRMSSPLRRHAVWV